MKNIWLYILLIFLSVACQNEDKSAQKKPTDTVQAKEIKPTIAKPGEVIDTLIIGTNDTAFVVKPAQIKDDIGDKRKEYAITVIFQHKTWPKLKYKNAIGAEIQLVGDLNGDQLPELLLRPEWFSSCWTSLNLYILKKNSWQLVKKGSMYFCSDEYPLNKRIIKTEKGFAMLSDSLTDDKFITLKKEIKF